MKLVKKPTSAKKRISIKRKKRVCPENLIHPAGRADGRESISAKQINEMTPVPEFLSHGGLFCPGCFHKVDYLGTLLLVRNRGASRWCLAHNNHVVGLGEMMEIIRNVGEYSFKEVDSEFPNRVSHLIQLQKVEEEKVGT